MRKVRAEFLVETTLPHGIINK